MLSQADHAKIAAAVTKAESRTTGEIVCILSHEVSNYRETPLCFAAAAALLLPPLAVLLGLSPHALTLLAGSGAEGWSVGAATPPSPARLIEAYALTQAVLFAGVAGVVSIPAVRRALTPSVLKRHRVHRAALQQFLATGLHASAARTGVVIFASTGDRRVELLADDAIHQAVGDAAWNAAIAAVQSGMKRGEPAAGFVRAVDICGEALAEHFPSSAPHANLIGDGLLEI